MQVMRGLNTDSVDLIYLDPPFNSDEDYGDPLSGDGDFKDKWTLDDVDHFEHGEIAEANPAAYSVISTAGMAHSKGMMAYLIFMAVRLMEMERILKSNTGHIFLHCDDTAGHYLKALLDAVFGATKFRGHITWKRTTAKNNAEHIFGRISDTIFHYAGTEASFFPQYVDHDDDYIEEKFVNDDGDGRGPYQLISTSSPGKGLREWKGYAPVAPSRRLSPEKMEQWDKEGKLHYPTLPDGSPDYSKTVRRKFYLTESKGKPVGNIWADIPPVNAKAKEALGYPTQKPVDLLERIINSVTKQDDLVLDPFCGCATTLVAADKLGRKWIGCDVSPLAVDKLHQRLTKDESKGKKNEDAVKPLLTEVIVFDVRDKDGDGKPMRRPDPLPHRNDDGVMTVKREDRHEIFGRQAGHCYGCWEQFPFEYMEVDHKNPKKKGGQNNPDNLQMLCRNCNRDKSGRTMSGWRADRRREHPEVFEREENRRLEVEARLKL